MDGTIPEKAQKKPADADVDEAGVTEPARAPEAEANPPDVPPVAAVPMEAAPAEQPPAVQDPAPPVAATDDWWDNFARAVEDPNVSIYEYLRDHAVQSMELEEKEGAPSALVQARQAALKEMFALTDPEELSKRLSALEKNKLLFNANARAVMKVSRAVLDTYIKTRKQSREGEKTPEEMSAIIGSSLKEELSGAQDEMNPALSSVAHSLKDKDEKEVAAVIRKAAAQMGEERNIMAMISDAAKFTRAYLKPDNVVNIAIIALPLVTWQYRWALAIGLGAFAGRHSLRHGYNSAAALYRGDRVEARAQGREMLANLKTAGGSVLLVALTPALAKYPALAAGFLGFAIEAAYHKVIDGFNKMLIEEEKVPGSTPLGRRLKAGIKTFFATYQDTLGSLSAKALKTLAPHTVTDAVEAFSKRMPLSKLRKVAARTWMVTGALGRRFNRVARATAKALRDDVADLAQDFVSAVEGALNDAARAATQRDAEMLAERLLMEERARAIAEEEARLAALAEEQDAYAEGADDGMEAQEEAPAQAEVTIEAEAQDAAVAAQALKKQKLRALARAGQKQGAQNRTRTMQARPS